MKFVLKDIVHVFHSGDLKVLPKQGLSIPYVVSPKVDDLGAVKDAIIDTWQRCYDRYEFNAPVAGLSRGLIECPDMALIGLSDSLLRDTACRHNYNPVTVINGSSYLWGTTIWIDGRPVTRTADFNTFATLNCLVHHGLIIRQDPIEEFFSNLGRSLDIECQRAMEQRDKFRETNISTASHGGSHDTCFIHIIKEHLRIAGIDIKKCLE